LLKNKHRPLFSSQSWPRRTSRGRGKDKSVGLLSSITLESWNVLLFLASLHLSSLLETCHHPNVQTFDRQCLFEVRRADSTGSPTLLLRFPSVNSLLHQGTLLRRCLRFPQRLLGLPGYGQIPLPTSFCVGELGTSQGLHLRM